jgi:WD40 repeat protein
LTIDISNDGKLLASAGQDQIVKVWMISTKELYHNFTGHKKPVTCVLFQFDSWDFCSGSLDGHMIFWSGE